MLSTSVTAHHVVHTWAIGNPVVARASLSIPDTLFLFVVALVVFGPKRLPEIGKQIGKLVFEFRRASNDFKLQIEEELRLSEQQERQKKIETQAAAAKPSTPAVAAAQLAAVSTPSDYPAEAASPAPPDRSITVQLPSSGTPVSALPPNHTAIKAETAELAEAPANALAEADSAADAVTEHETQHG
jgi:sec-independent protein translocase protein TatB